MCNYDSSETDDISYCSTKVVLSSSLARAIRWTSIYDESSSHRIIVLLRPNISTDEQRKVCGKPSCVFVSSYGSANRCMIMPNFFQEKSEG